MAQLAISINNHGQIDISCGKVASPWQSVPDRLAALYELAVIHTGDRSGDDQEIAGMTMETLLIVMRERLEECYGIESIYFTLERTRIHECSIQGQLSVGDRYRITIEPSYASIDNNDIKQGLSFDLELLNEKGKQIAKATFVYQVKSSIN